MEGTGGCGAIPVVGCYDRDPVAVPTSRERLPEVGDEQVDASSEQLNTKPERFNVRAHPGGCVSYEEAGCLVWDYREETRDWELVRRIESLAASEQQAAVVVVSSDDVFTV